MSFESIPRTSRGNQPLAERLALSEMRKRLSIEEQAVDKAARQVKSLTNTILYEIASLDRIRMAAADGTDSAARIALFLEVVLERMRLAVGNGE
jgi:hypothetical protein